MEDQPRNGFTYEEVKNIADFLSERNPYKPKIGIICGTGMGGIANILEDTYPFAYSDIPNFPISTVQGHVGRLIFGRISDVPVVCMQGRLHHYEGYPLWKCVMPVRVMKMLGCTHLIVSNAAGGLNPDFKVGDIMLIKDHVNFMGLAGNGPLYGPNDERFGPRFFSMNKAYNPEYIKEARRIALEIGIDDIKEGVYCAVGGPNFETNIETKMLGLLGIDAVGGSTVHEVIIARHSSIQVFGFSLITNVSSGNDVSHETNLDIGSKRGPLLERLVEKMVTYIASTF